MYQGKESLSVKACEVRRWPVTEESGCTKDQDPEATPICGPIQGQEPSEEQVH